MSDQVWNEDGGSCHRESRGSFKIAMDYCNVILFLFCAVTSDIRTVIFCFCNREASLV